MTAIAQETTLEKFEAMVKAHDLTFEYTEDYRVWCKGRAEKNAIRRLAEELPHEDVERIWNANVDKIIKGSLEERERWYWPGLKGSV